MGKPDYPDQAVTEALVTNIFSKLIDFCSIPRARAEMMEISPIQSVTCFRKTFLNPLLNSGKIKMTILDKPNSKNQKYVKTR